MARRVLIVVHQEHSTPGRVGELLALRGCALERRCPNLGDPLPAELSPYSAAIVFGGPQSANDDHLPGIRAELDWLERTALPAGPPLLGICLGAQMIARALGAKVGPHREGLVEIGYHPVYPTAAGAPYFDGPTLFYQWHKETFEIPAGTVHLAHNDAFDAQAFCYDRRAYGIEFHPEMTLAMIERWTRSEKGSAMLDLPGAQPRAAQLEAYRRCVAATDRWLGRFLDGWLLCGDDRAAATGAAAT
ncbi:MAG: glutamine amidotransferase-related protein [Geminicoccaceae bacterium]